MNQIKDGGSQGKALLEAGKSISIDVPNGKTIKLNNHQTSFHRTYYSKELQSELVEVLKSNPLSLHEMDRVGLMDDAFHLAISGDYTYSQGCLAFRVS